MADDFKYFLFDWDGCLADSLSIWMAVYSGVYTSYGVAATIPEIVEKSWGNLEQGPLNFRIPNHRKVWDEIVHKVAEKMKTVELFKGAKELLQDLRKQGKKVAIVTSSRRAIVEPAIKFHGIDRLLDFLITEQEVSKPKPDPEILNTALVELGGAGEKDQAVIIGDSDKDIYAGKAANIHTVLVLHPENQVYYSFADLKKSKPDFIIESFAELNSSK